MVRERVGILALLGMGFLFSAGCSDGDEETVYIVQAPGEGTFPGGSVYANDLRPKWPFRILNKGGLQDTK